MTAVQHTPGPWHCARSKLNDLWTVYTQKAKNIAAVDDPYNREDDVAKANAHLIAAAPDLLDALKEVVAISDRKHNAWDKARAAIAKATGAV